MGEKRYETKSKFELEAGNEMEAIETKIGLDQIKNTISPMSFNENKKIIEEDTNNRNEYEARGDKFGENRDVKRDGLRENELGRTIVFGIKAIKDRILSKQADIRSLISGLERKREYREARQSDLVVKRADIKELSDIIDANEKTIDLASNVRGLAKRFGRNAKELCAAFGEFARKFDKVVRTVAGFINNQRGKIKSDDEIEYEDEVTDKNPKRKPIISDYEKQKSVATIDDLFM